MIKICEDNSCTGCGMCAKICPKKAIRYEENKFGTLLPVIDASKCVECQLCRRICPQNNGSSKNDVQTVLMGYSENDTVRKLSASGGVASELYEYYLGQGYCCYGVEYDANRKVAHYIQVKTVEDIYRVLNSKYVFSSYNIPFEQIDRQIIEEKGILFIGLPCQVDAIKSYLFYRKRNIEKIIFVDIICHGTANSRYLEQHLEKVVASQKISKVYFRDPECGSNSYKFSIYDAYNRCIYRKGVAEDDVYQLGYHRALIYRENCYYCNYAEAKRIGDLTLGDFSGLGKCATFIEKNKDVSCILVNTIKGCMVIKNMEEAHKLHTEVRPKEEAFLFERQLQAPSIKHPKRDVFIQTYASTGDFDKAARAALKAELKNYWCRRILMIDAMGFIARKVMSPTMKKKVKVIIKLWKKKVQS